MARRMNAGRRRVAVDDASAPWALEIIKANHLVDDARLALTDAWHQYSKSRGRFGNSDYLFDEAEQAVAALQAALRLEFSSGVTEPW